MNIYIAVGTRGVVYSATFATARVLTAPLTTYSHASRILSPCSTLYFIILNRWNEAVAAKNAFTAANKLFFGVITKDHRVHIAAVANSDKFCAPLTFSTGLLASAKPATTNPHFKVGAQKCTVRGPVSLCQNRLNANDTDDMGNCVCVCVCVCVYTTGLPFTGMVSH